MIKSYLAAALAAATLAVPLASAPAYADHTLCDNETWDPRANVAGHLVGADTDGLPGTLWICVDYGLIVIRTDGGQQTVCTYYDWHDPSTRQCQYV